MKTLLAIFCCTLSVPAFAQITAAAPTYTVTDPTAGTASKTTSTMVAPSANTVTMNAQGQPDDDPADPVTLTATEDTTVISALTTNSKAITTVWQKRTQAALARARLNPNLIK